jgi:hypothetical protein
MTNFKTEIEEIEKRFDEKFPLIFVKQHKDGTGNMSCRDSDVKAFWKEELPSLLSKFAGEINTPEKEAPDKDTFAQEYLGKTITPVNLLEIIAVGKANSWNAHHRSVAEKAEEIIKQLK